MSTVITRYALLFVIGAVILLAATGNLFSSSVAAIAVQLLAVGLLVWARRSFPPNSFRVDASPSADAVIRRGPYRWIRHPMYSGVLLFIWAAILSHLSGVTIAIGTVATIITALRIVYEERFLRDRYPEYAAYARMTKAVIPYLV